MTQYIWTKRPSGILDYRPDGDHWCDFLSKARNHVAWVAYRGGFRIWHAEVIEHCTDEYGDSAGRFHMATFKSPITARRWCERKIAEIVA